MCYVWLLQVMQISDYELQHSQASLEKKQIVRKSSEFIISLIMHKLCLHIIA